MNERMNVAQQPALGWTDGEIDIQTDGEEKKK